MTVMPMKRPITRFYALDTLRGLAALLVIIFHFGIWHHRDFERPPLESWLPILYTNGWMMVDLFFCLSGFIFFWKYSGAIYEKSIGFKEFIFLRFSRLYPLHIATLIIVGVGQLFVYLSDKEYFIFQLNDLKHLLLNIFFMSYWGFEDGYSFNGPVWSVSIEILLYLVFYFCCFRLKPTYFFLPALMITLGWLLLSGDYHFILFNTMVGRGLISFFAGGLSYQIFRMAIACHQTIYLGIVILAGCTALTFWATLNSLHFNFRAWFNEIVFLIGFPSTVLLLAFLDAEKVFATIFKKLSYLGDISYGIYLIHFPVQIFFHLASKQFQIDYSRTETFLLYLACTLGLAIASHRFFEIPCQRYLRSKFPSGQ
jgi:peptidoglycan/LPS O-acetylase OafA/YrhL